MKILNNWREFLIIGVIISFLLQRYTDFEGWAYIFIAFGFGFIYDFVFNKKKEKLRLENPHNLPIKPKQAYSKEWVDNLDYFGESYRSSNYKKS